MWKLSIGDEQGQKTAVNLVRDEYTVGRAEGCIIRLTERNISRHHATIRRSALGYRIEDQGSLTGVFVNGVRITSPQELSHKDSLQLGDYRIEVIDEDLQIQEQNHLPFSSSTPPSGRLPHRLVVLIGPEQGAEYALEGERFLLGRGEECDFRLDHASVSRVHAEVRLVDSSHYEIIDKGSANGLRVNGHELPRSLLDSRDVIELGDVVLKYIPQGQVFRASPTEGQRIAALGGLTPPPPRSIRATTPAWSLAAACAGAALTAIAALAWFNMESEAQPLESEQDPASLRAQTRKLSPLEEAQRLRSAGTPLLIHEALQQLPQDHPARQTEQFQELEAIWARAMLEEAQEAELPRRRQLLEQVASAESVPLELRETAFELLKKSRENSLDLSDLGKKQRPRVRPASSTP